MKKIDVKCPKCGKVWQLDSKTYQEEINCPHCHKALSLDKKYRTLSKVTLFVVLLISAIILSVITQLVANGNTTVILVIAIAFSVLTVGFMEKLAGKICFSLNNFTYSPVEKEENNKKEKKK